MIFQKKKEKWTCKTCGFETNEEILYLTHILEKHPEVTKDQLVAACEFYKTFCNRMKFFLEQHGEDLPEDQRVIVGDYLAENDFKGFDKWLFYYAFEHMFEDNNHKTVVSL